MLLLSYGTLWFCLAGDTMTGSPRRIAIVGGGIAGIACSWELRKHSARNVRVDIYESESKLGGHANSVPFKGNGTSVDVDTGFIVMDEATYRELREDKKKRVQAQLRPMVNHLLIQRASTLFSVI